MVLPREQTKAIRADFIHLAILDVEILIPTYYWTTAEQGWEAVEDMI